MSPTLRPADVDPWELGMLDEQEAAEQDQRDDVDDEGWSP